MTKAMLADYMPPRLSSSRCLLVSFSYKSFLILCLFHNSLSLAWGHIYLFFYTEYGTETGDC